MSVIAVDYAYAWKCGPRWIASYIRSGRIVAAARTSWWTLVRGHIGEACQICGRPYQLWHADDALYAAVTGQSRKANGEYAGGLFCLGCFDRMADEAGITLRWVPHNFAYESEADQQSGPLAGNTEPQHDGTTGGSPSVDAPVRHDADALAEQILAVADRLKRWGYGIDSIVLEDAVTALRSIGGKP